MAGAASGSGGEKDDADGVGGGSDAGEAGAADAGDLIPLARDEGTGIDDGVVGPANRNVLVDNYRKTIGIDGVAVAGEDAAVPCAGR